MRSTTAGSGRCFLAETLLAATSLQEGALMQFATEHGKWGKAQQMRAHPYLTSAQLYFCDTVEMDISSASHLSLAYDSLWN